MSVTVVQTATGINSPNPAQIIFGSTPGNGNLLLFFVGVANAVTGNLTVSPNLKVLGDSLNEGVVYYHRYATGEVPAWAFSIPGAVVDVVGYELAGASLSVQFVDSTPIWGGGTYSPASDNQQSTVTPSSASTGGLALSVLTEGIGGFATSQTSPWVSPVSIINSGSAVYVYQAPTTPGTPISTNWVVANGTAATYWSGTIVVVDAWNGITPPTANAGGQQFVQAFSSVTLSGSATTAAGHTATYAWTALTVNAPAVTSGASTLTAIISNTGAPYKLTEYSYQLFVTQDDGQTATSIVVVTVAPASMFQLTGATVNTAHAQVQSNIFTLPSATGNITSLPVTLTNAVGSTLVLAISIVAGGSTPVTITSLLDTGGNTWQYSSAASSQSPPTGGSLWSANTLWGFSAVAYCIAAPHVAGTITCTINVPVFASGGQYFSLQVHEFTGVPAGSMLDGSAASSTFQVTPTITPEIVTAANSDVVVLSCASQFSLSTVPSGFTLGSDFQTAWGITAGAGTQAVTSSLESTSAVMSWAILGIGNPAVNYENWYGMYPAKLAHGGSWV